MGYPLRSMVPTGMPGRRSVPPGYGERTPAPVRGIFISILPALALWLILWAFVRFLF
jgi:hypothetical protein